MREIQLIGGAYKDNSLTFSAQDTVNWLPVPDEVGAARSAIKLRGLPGMKALNKTVVPLPPEITLVTNLSVYTGMPPDSVSGTTRLIPIQPFTSSENNDLAAASPDGFLVAASNITLATPIQSYQGTITSPWTEITAPIAGGIGPDSISYSPNGDFLVVGIEQAPFIRAFTRTGTAWVEIANNGPAAIQIVDILGWDSTGTRIICRQATGAERVLVYEFEGETFRQVAKFSGAPDHNPYEGCFAPLSKTWAIIDDSIAPEGLVVANISPPSITYPQSVALPANAAGRLRFLGFINPTTLIACWTSGTARVQLFNWASNALSSSGPCPWQPVGSGGQFALSRNGRYLAYNGDGTPAGTVVIDTTDWSNVTIPTASVSAGSVVWLDWVR